MRQILSSFVQFFQNIVPMNLYGSVRFCKELGALIHLAFKALQPKGMFTPWLVGYPP
jgi:hypothetical protein